MSPIKEQSLNLVLGFQHFEVLLRLTNWRDFFMKKNDTVIKTDCNYLGRLAI